MKCPPSVQTPEDYLAWVPDKWRQDLTELHELILQAAPSLEPSIRYGMIGYGASRDEVRVSLAAQKNNIALYLCASDEKGYLPELHAADLGKVSCGKSCIRFKKLTDLNLPLAIKLVAQAEQMKKDGNEPTP
jgi:hypothetical protein